MSDRENLHGNFPIVELKGWNTRCVDKHVYKHVDISVDNYSNDFSAIWELNSQIAERDIDNIKGPEDSGPLMGYTRTISTQSCKRSKRAQNIGKPA